MFTAVFDICCWIVFTVLLLLLSTNIEHTMLYCWSLLNEVLYWCLMPLLLHCPASRMELEGNAWWHCWSVQTTEDVSRSLAAIKTTLYGSGGEDASAEVLTQLSQEMCSGHLLQQLIENLGKIDFEASSSLAVHCMWWKFSTLL